jgi:hypothetical protein
MTSGGPDRRETSASQQRERLAQEAAPRRARWLLNWRAQYDERGWRASFDAGGMEEQEWKKTATTYTHCWSVLRS